MTGIGPEFLKLLRGIEWDTLTARDAVDLRAALKEAMDHSNEWFRKLTDDFAGTVLESALKRAEQTATVAPPAKVESGRPPAEVSPPRPKPTVRAKVTLKRKRGRPPVQQRARPNPIAIGGANAETAAGPQAAKLFENSYVSKDGPRADIPASLPADHPRLNLHRETSVTPEQDVQDFQTVERALASGRGVKDIFEVR
jgi:hypothetical protein